MTTEERERELAARNDLIEKLADIEHQRWSDWQRWMQDERCRPELNQGRGHWKHVEVVS